MAQLTVGRLSFSLRDSGHLEFHDFNSFTVNLAAGKIEWVLGDHRHVVFLYQLESLTVRVPGMPDWRVFFTEGGSSWLQT